MKKVFQKPFQLGKISGLIAVGFLFGVALSSLIEFHFWWFYLVGCLFFLQALIYKNKFIWLTLFLGIGFSLGVLRTSYDIIRISSLEKELNFAGEVIVVSVPEAKDDYQKVVVQRRDNFSEKSFQGKFLIFAKPKPTIKFGDQLQVSCKMKVPENKHLKFNYKRFLASEKIFYICSFAKIQKISEERPNGLLAGIFSVRGELENKIKEYFPEPEGAYLAGLLLGGDDRLPKKVAENFRKTGTTHTVAVSGYNITIIASILMWMGIALGLWRVQAFILAVIGIIIFVVMIGAPSSATRAAVMGIIMLWALQKGRLADSVRVAIFTATGMVLFSPFILLYDVGFQLSFLAMLGIILIYSPLALLTRVEGDFLELKSILLVTISAQIGVLGLLIYVFESFSLVSILANLIILPFIPLIMFFGFSTILISFLFPFLSKMLALVVWFFLHFEIYAIEQLAKIPFANIEIGNIGVYWFVGYYLFFIGLVFKLRRLK